MVFVFEKHVAVGLDMRGISGAVVPDGCDAILVPRILINPLFLEPLLRVRFIRGDEVKTLGIRPWRVTEWSDVTRQQKIERLNLVVVAFFVIELFEGPH